MKDAYLLSGSNKGNREDNLRTVISRLKIQGKVGAVSACYESDPWGYESHSKFVNQAIHFKTNLEPLPLLRFLKEIEYEMGRRHKGSGYEDRIIDVDILFYEEEIIRTPLLTLPHPRLHLRLFTLLPLMEIAPDLIHPVFQRSVSALREVCTDKGIPVRL